MLNIVSLYKGRDDKSLYPLNNDCPAFTSGNVAPVNGPVRTPCFCFSANNAPSGENSVLNSSQSKHL